MKPERHAKILELIEHNEVETQEQLLSMLTDIGYDVTQATISRDIRTLRLIKAAMPDGSHRYVREAKGALAGAITAKYANILSESLTSVETAMNMIVVKTYSGMANAAAAAIDAFNLGGVVGTLAGDDTIFLAMRDSTSLQQAVSELSAMIKPHSAD